jgi:hypothetical protein
MLDANRSGTATTPPPAAAPASPADASASPAAVPRPVLVPAAPGVLAGGTLPRAGFVVRCARLLLSPYARLSLLLALLAGGAAGGGVVAVPERLASSIRRH